MGHKPATPNINYIQFVYFYFQPNLEFFKVWAFSVIGNNYPSAWANFRTGLVDFQIPVDLVHDSTGPKPGIFQGLGAPKERVNGVFSCWYICTSGSVTDHILPDFLPPTSTSGPSCKKPPHANNVLALVSNYCRYLTRRKILSFHFFLVLAFLKLLVLKQEYFEKQK